MFSSSPPDRKLRQCVMPSCDGQRFDLVHKFPMDNERAETWRRIINIPHLMKLPIAEVRKKYFICSRHFPKRDYKNCESRSLNKTALPRLFLIANATEGRENEVENENENEILNQSSLLDDNINMHNSVVNNTIMIIEQQDEKCTNVENLIRLKKVRSPTSATQLSANSSKIIMHSIKKQHSSPVKTLIKSNQSENNNLIRGIKRIPSTKTVTVKSQKIPKFSYIESDPLEEMTDSSDADNYITVEHSFWPNGLALANVWLRDHCRCPDCYDETTMQRKVSILNISLDVKASKHSLVGDNLVIDWTDGHHSNYPFEELTHMLKDRRNKSIEAQSILWKSKDVNVSKYARVTLNDFLCDDEVAKNVVQSLIIFGFAFIENVPPNIQSTEVAIKRLFPIQKTFFGEMWSVSDTQLHADNAYSRDALYPHNDNTYFNDAAGLQIFHCVHHNGSGGENIFVDGFRAAQDLKNSDPLAFKYLTETNLTAEYIEEGRHHKHTQPVIILNSLTDRPEQIRFNMNDRAPFNTLPQNEVLEFYKNYRLFAEKVVAPANEWKFKLTPGTVCIFDNWRILHGRTAYTGKRQVVGCYVARNEFLSVARTMELIS